LPETAYGAAILDRGRLAIVKLSTADPELALSAQHKARINPVTVDTPLIRCVRAGRKQDLNSQAENLKPAAPAAGGNSETGH
jgi:hypothetical protein